MAEEIIQVEYAKLTQVAQSFDAASNDVHSVVKRVEESMNRLKNGGWVTDASSAFLTDMNSNVLQGISRLSAGLQQANTTTLEIVRLLSQAEDAAGQSLGRAMTGGSGAAAGAGAIFPLGQMPWNSDDLRRATLGTSFPNSRYPSQTEILRRYLGGELTHDQAHSLMKIASTDRVLPNFVDPKAILHETDLIKRYDESAHRNEDHYTFGDSGTATTRFDVSNVDYGAKGEVYLGEDGLSAKISGDASYNLLRYRAGATYNGVQGTFDARAGLGASGSAGVKFNPFEGEVQAQVKGEAFAGAEATASANYSNDLFSVTGTVSGAAGLGARGHFTLDLDPSTGKLKWSAGAMGSVLLGGGGGVEVELDIPRTVEFIRDEAERGVQNLYNGVSDFVDSVLNRGNQ